jgi:hypothetical protein
VLARELKKGNIQAHAEMRIEQGVKPATVASGRDVFARRAEVRRLGMGRLRGHSDGAITAALPFMKKHSLVSKSTPRDRLPQDEEIARLRAFYRKQAQHRTPSCRWNC